MNVSSKKRSIWVAFLGLVLLVGLQSASAISLTLGDGRYLGLIEYGIPSGDQNREDYVNTLIDLGVNEVLDNTAVDGQKYTRSAVSTGGFPDAVFAENRDNSGSYDVGSGYTYLFAKYNGPNYGSLVWYIDGLTGDIEIPVDMGQPGSGLSGVSFFNPTNGVPDGGSSILLLGLGLLGLEGLRRRVMT